MTTTTITALTAGATLVGTEVSPFDQSGSTVKITATQARTFAWTSPTFVGNVTLPDAGNIIVNTSTGSKIGTATGQKLGFWNATPVVQQVLATGALKTVDDVITLLQTLGLCKQS